MGLISTVTCHSQSISSSLHTPVILSVLEVSPFQLMKEGSPNHNASLGSQSHSLMESSVKASCRGLTCSDCSPSLISPPPYSPDVRRSRVSEAHLITSFLISTLALVPSFKCSKVILKNISFCFHFASAWPSHKSGLGQNLRGLG